MKSITNMHRPLQILIHSMAWGIVLLFPILMEWGSDKVDWSEYLHRLPVPLSFMAMFYINYFYLIDTYLFRQKAKRFIIINLLLIVLISIGTHIRNEFFMMKQKSQISITQINNDSITSEVKANKKAFIITDSPSFKPKNRKFKHLPKEFEELDHGWFHWRMVILFLFRDLLSLTLTVGLAVAIKTTSRWYEAETARRELEKSKTEAELKNLKNQLNPHFLLNTLNNIYALIAFDNEKAQQAVQDLSKLLRYVLYDNQQNYVPLSREADFICNYVELMKIRLTDNIHVETNITLLPGSSTMIAPLIFISLIENAFKHGISPIESSFILISLIETEDNKIICKIVNSYHPKTNADKSGSGIGLGQVSKRLELLYPGRYIWHKGVSDNGKEYESLLIINLEKRDL